MKIHKIIFFVGLLLIINQFLGVTSDIKKWVDIIFGLFLIILGVYLKLNTMKEGVSINTKETEEDSVFEEKNPQPFVDGGLEKKEGSTLKEDDNSSDYFDQEEKQDDIDYEGEETNETKDTQ